MFHILDSTVLSLNKIKDPSKVGDLLGDFLLLLDVGGAKIVIRPNHPEPLVYTQGPSGDNSWLYIPHARDASSFLIRNNLRTGVSLSSDYAEISNKCKYNLHKASIHSALAGK